jgi:hypothetical protein
MITFSPFSSIHSSKLRQKFDYLSSITNDHVEGAAEGQAGELGRRPKYLRIDSCPPEFRDILIANCLLRWVLHCDLAVLVGLCVLHEDLIRAICCGRVNCQFLLMALT